MCVAVPSGILSSTTRRGQVSLTLMLPASSEGDVPPLKQTNSEWGVPPHKQTNVSRMSTNKPDHGLLSSKKKYLRKNLNRDQMMNTQEEHTTRSAHVLFITSSRYNSRVICSHNYVWEFSTVGEELVRRRCTHQIDVTWQHRDVFLESSVEESVHFKPDALVASQHSCSCCLLTAVCGRDQGPVYRFTGDKNEARTPEYMI